MLALLVAFDLTFMCVSVVVYPVLLFFSFFEIG